jgi:uncharacterized membrane protein YfcA
LDNILQAPGFDTLRWIVIVIAAFAVGFAKTGIGGVTMLVIPVLAAVFGGRDSTGILLPMLLVGDVFAILYYHRSAQWRDLAKPLPWALAGVVLGGFVGNYISDTMFARLIGLIVLACLGILVYTERKKHSLTVPDKAWFYITIGIVSGFSSMIGNAAGPIFSVYLLALGFNKNSYMGTNAWFFFLVNLSKMPFQIFVWHNIGVGNALIAALMIPVIAAGALTGGFILKRINEEYFRYIIIAMTAIAAVRLVI